MILYFTVFWLRWKSCKILIKILQDLVRKKLYHFNWTHIPPPSLSSKWNISQLKRTKKSKESSTRISHLHTNIAMCVLCQGPKPSMAVKTKDCSCLNCLILVTGFQLFFFQEADSCMNTACDIFNNYFIVTNYSTFPSALMKQWAKTLPQTQHKLLNLSSRSLVR